MTVNEAIMQVPIGDLFVLYSGSRRTLWCRVGAGNIKRPGTRFTLTLPVFWLPTVKFHRFSPDESARMLAIANMSAELLSSELNNLELPC